MTASPLRTLCKDFQFVIAAYLRHEGDLLAIDGGGAATSFRIGSAARFVVLDLGAGHAPNSGKFWVHYAIPTPSKNNGVNTRGRRVLVRIDELC
jgi:hypothetical protein